MAEKERGLMCVESTITPTNVFSYRTAISNAKSYERHMKDLVQTNYVNKQTSEVY